MNMIVNKSDLVGYEAVETKAAKKEALAKLVAAWESKQAQNARRFGGLGFLAVSLAACNSSDDDIAYGLGRKMSSQGSDRLSNSYSGCHLS